MAFIEIIEHDNAVGQLKEIYDDLVDSRGKLAQVHKIQSLNPKSIIDHMNLYMTLMYGKSPLKRNLREMMAVVVSRANDCEYCQVHHAEALAHYWKDNEKVNQLRLDYHCADLSALELALCHLSWHLTKFPGQHTENEFIKPLKDLGLNDRAVLDATMIIAYFNFVNRIVLGLGVNLESNPGGYNYN